MAHERPKKSEAMSHLMRQVRHVRDGQPLSDGKLQHFRRALQTEDFPQKVLWVKVHLGVDMFSNLAAIESMEAEILKGDATELTVQCAMAVEMCLEIFPGATVRSVPEIERFWLFGSSPTMEKIAYVASRLHFVRNTSALRAVVDDGLVRAVGVLFSDLDWHGMLLVLKETRPSCAFRLFTQLSALLERASDNIPQAAATLLLSYVSEAITTIAAHLEDYTCPVEENIVKRLLRRGASPMVSKDDHFTLFEMLHGAHEGAGTAWRLENEDAAPEKDTPHPTALNRLLRHQWTPGFLAELHQHACCHLDATDALKKNFGLKVLSLRCLAAQRLREFELNALPSTIKFFASKHRPFPLSLTCSECYFH